MPDLQTRELKRVEILDVGTWAASTGPLEVTQDDLAAYVATFEATKDALAVPAKLGHDEGQRLLQQDGYPAAGWLEKLYVDGTKLKGDFGDVPAKIADLVDARAYRKVSAEIWNDVTVGDQTYAHILMGVAFLGEDIPAITTLSDLESWYGVRPRQLPVPRSTVTSVTHATVRDAARAGSAEDHVRAKVANLVAREGLSFAAAMARVHRSDRELVAAAAAERRRRFR